MAGTEPYIGEVALFAHNVIPSGWLPCDGRLLAITSNIALYSVLGLTYGGDGWNTFALPDLNGRAAMGAGQGPGLSWRAEGEQGGQAQVTLRHTEMPSHSHATQAAGSATTGNPVGAVPARGTAPLRNASPTATETLGGSGGGQPHNNMQPSLALQYCIAVTGVYPSEF